MHEVTGSSPVVPTTSKGESPCFHKGVIAQLVERLNGIQEVRGSTPLSSTKIGTTTFVVVPFVIRGVWIVRTTQ